MNQDANIRIRLDASTVPAAAAQAAKAVGTIGQAGQVSARQTAAAMRMLPAQFTDVATQLAGGQNPLLVLLQQGGQVKDSFGGIGPALRGVAAGLAAIFTPAAVAIGTAVAAVGAFGFAAYKGARESAALRDTLALTGNAAGLTADRMATLADDTSNASQQTVGGAREIAMALAASGQVGSVALDSMAEAVARVADVTGGDAKKISADFAGMAGGVAKWAAEHNKAWNFITVEQYKYIRRLEEQGKAEEAMVYVNEQVIKHVSDQAKNLGTLERAWDSIGKVASQAWDFMLGVGREETTRQQLDIAMARLEALGGNLSPRAREAAEQRIQFLKEQLRLENQQANARASNAQKERGAIAKEQADERAAAQEARTAQSRADANRKFIADLLQDNRRAAIDLIADEQAKGLALIASDRDNALDRLAEQKLAGAELLQARSAIDAAAAIARAKLNAKLSAEADKDPLGEFITEKVMPAHEERLAKRKAMEDDFLQDLRDANARAGIMLLADEEERGRQLVEHDRQVAMRRLQAKGFGSGARETAEGLINRSASLELEGLGKTLKESTYEDVKSALSAALRDSSNPAKAFADALGNVIYQRLTASIADALATAAVGKDGKGGLWGDLLSIVGSIGGGGVAVDTNSGTVNDVVPGRPRGGMATGTNYVPRDMFLLAHRGEAIVPARYNPAAGGQGGAPTALTIHYHVPPGQSPAAFAGALADHTRKVKAEVASDMMRKGRPLNNAMAVGSR